MCPRISINTVCVCVCVCPPSSFNTVCVCPPSSFNTVCVCLLRFQCTECVCALVFLCVCLCCLSVPGVPWFLEFWGSFSPATLRKRGETSTNFKRPSTRPCTSVCA